MPPFNVTIDTVLKIARSGFIKVVCSCFLNFIVATDGVWRTPYTLWFPTSRMSRFNYN
jgi:hypothetical protein